MYAVKRPITYDPRARRPTRELAAAQAALRQQRLGPIALGLLIVAPFWAAVVVLAWLVLS